jgi:cytosine/adenosine deaminase-related metal-dependent hydrolase
MRAKGAIRVVQGRIAGIGELDPLPGEERIDASGCVVYPGLISTHHHLFQSVLKGVRAGIDCPLFQWLRVVPHAYWHKIDEEALRVAARVGLVELLLSGTTTAADHHYMFAQDYRFDPAHVIFEVAQELGIRLVFCRGGATRFRGFDTPDIIPMPTEPLDHMLRSVSDCARRYHDPSSGSTRRVACAVTTPPWAVAPDELKIIAASARGMGLRIHSHLSETRDYVDYCLATFGKRRCRGWRITTGSAPTCGSPISFMSTTRKWPCWSKPGPAWPIARSPIAGSAPELRRRKKSRRSAARCRLRSTVRRRTNPPT